MDLGASRGEVTHLAPLIVAYLLDGYCMGPSEYPDPQSFVKDIIALYGHDGVIPIEGEDTASFGPAVRYSVSVSAAIRQI